MPIDQAALLKVALRHASAEAEMNLPAILDTMEGEPVYEFFPLGKKFVGMELTKRYYQYYIDDFCHRIAGYKMRAEWLNDVGLAQEYSIDCRVAGRIKTFRIFSILVFGKAKLKGERLYGDEEFFRMLCGPVWNEIVPIDPAE